MSFAVMVAVQELVFHMPKLVGQVYVYLVGIFQPLGFFPEGIHFPHTVLPDVHDFGGPVNAAAILEDRNQKFPQRIAVRRKMGLFPGLDGVEKQQGVGGV